MTGEIVDWDVKNQNKHNALMIDFVLANSAVPDEMQHSVEFHLGLHCLQTYPCRGFQSTKGF